MKKTFYVTTPIYYPSGNLHIGHVYTTTLAWILKNYKVLDGYDAKFLTGADEHGQKIEKKAQEMNIEPQTYVDLMNKKFINLWKLLDIEYDYYSRTTNPKHMKSIQKQFSELLKKDLIYIGKYKGLYSIQDEEFFTKRQAKKIGDKYFHPTSDHELKEVEEESYFFKMSQYNDWIKNYYKNHDNFIWPHSIKKELLNNFIEKGLEDLSVSRNTFKWGIPIVEDSKHILYVWMDALNNYVTALGYNSKDDSDFKKYWENGDEIVHIIGKEISRFHCIYWPIILKAADLREPTSILSHGWIITDEGKMSKSKGNVIDPIELANKYGAEELKYFLSSQIKTGQDGVFSEESFKNTINAHLANNIGNLLSRTVAMFKQNFDKPVKYRIDLLNDVDHKVLASISQKFKQYREKFNKYEISAALEIAVELSKELNGYIDITMPWKLKDNLARLEVVINTLLNGIYAVASMLQVVLPQKMLLVKNQLSVKELSFKDIDQFNKFDNISPIQGDIIFKRY